MSSKYQTILQFMYAQLPMYQRQGAPAFKKTLDNIIDLCAHLGNPQDQLSCIHVGGTNGKGSTSHMIAAMLQANGFRVGLYTSPHYKDFRERIKINGSFISENEVVQFIEDNKAFIQELQPSFFELTVAMAFQYFANKKVDIAVIEVGLGGRLDSTNIIRPILSVITNISLDHQAMLGNTVQEIAREKGGIIKPNIPVIIGERQKEVEAIFYQQSELVNAPLSIASDSVRLENTLHGYTVYINEKIFCKRLKTDIKGSYQLNNLKTALLTVFQLRQRYNLNIRALKKGISRVGDLTYFLGRWQVLGTKPLIIGDSAHNEAGLDLVLDEVKRLKAKKLHFVLGFVKDKEVAKVLRKFPEDAHYYFAKANIPRGMEVSTLKEHGDRVGLDSESFDSVQLAFQAAKAQADNSDLIYVGGSIFVLAEIL